jgi:hypothetical protein
MELEINIPTSLNEITLGDFQKYWESEQSDIDKLTYILKLTPSTIGSLKRKYFNELVEIIDRLLNSEVEFTQFVTLGGVDFGFIPNFENISQAEFIDIDENISDISTLHTACAVMFRQIKEREGIKYSVIDYNPEYGFDELMKHLPLGVALGSKVFFWTLGRELSLIIPSYLAGEVAEVMNIPLNINSQNVGVGMAQ